MNTPQYSASPPGPPTVEPSSPAMRLAYDLARLYSAVDRPVVFVGPIGSGKTLLAHYLHTCSGRPGEFVALSAGEVSESLYHDSLFGHLPGAFTGATSRRKGAFERAANGTVFFDDVAYLPRVAQTAVLRVLENRAFSPIGLAGGLNLYGYAGGDPVNLSDPFGLAVCFGTGDDAAGLQSATEEATGTEISVGDDGCVESFEDVGGEKFAEVQGIFGELIASDVFFFVAGVNKGNSSFDEISTLDGSTAYRAEISSKNLVPSFTFSSCSTGRFEVYDGAQLIAHELIGHGSGIVRPGLLGKLFGPRAANQKTAIRLENVSNNARGRPIRCGG